VPALVLEPMPLSVIGVLALLGTMGYSGKPFGLKYKALGDITVLILCGPGLTLGFCWAAFGQIDQNVVALGMFFGLAAVGILHVNNWQDIDVDKRAGATTVASAIGGTASKIYLVLLYVGAIAAWIVVALALKSWFLAVPALALVPTAMLVKDVLTATDPSAPKLALVRIKAAQVHLLLGVTMCIGLGIALATH
jgi:1,4-dihydroxy-2-naphthoate octaprenyltransferase